MLVGLPVAGNIHLCKGLTQPFQRTSSNEQAKWYRRMTSYHCIIDWMSSLIIIDRGPFVSAIFYSFLHNSVIDLKNTVRIFNYKYTFLIRNMPIIIIVLLV